MTTYDSDNYALDVTANTPSTLLDPGQWGGRVRAQVSSYTCATTVTGSVIRVGKLPVGAVILPGSSINAAALGGSTSFTVGDTGSAARYATVADSSGATFTNFETTGGVNYEITSDDVDITVTIGGASATGVIMSTILYSYG